MKGKGTKKVKYESGEAARFVSRKHAMRKLQLNLKVYVLKVGLRHIIY